MPGAAPSMNCPLVISGPSGSGKSTILNRLFKNYPNSFGFSVSRRKRKMTLITLWMAWNTTRAPRPGETDGVQYHFVDRAKFGDMVSKRQFIESVDYAGNLYGTSFGAVQDITQSGRVCVLDIETQGVQLVKSNPDFHAYYVFIRPPSIDALASRLASRGSDSQEAIQRRLQIAQSEIQFAESSGIYDQIILNEDLEKAYIELQTFVQKHYSLAQ